MKMIEITSKWAVVADHIVDIWLGGEDNKTFNVSYDIPNRPKDSITLDDPDEAKKVYTRVLNELRGHPSISEED